MKKILLISSVLCAAVFYASAQTPETLQIEKGTGIVSIDMPFTLSLHSTANPNGTNSNNQSFTYKPVISGGYFVARNFMIGGGFGVTKTWNRSRNQFGNVNENSSPTFLNPSFIMRYYYMFSPKVGFYGQYAMEGALQADGGQPRANGFNMALSPRMVFLPIPSVGINVGMGEMGYAFRAYDEAGDGVSPSYTHDFLLEPTIHLGASFFIGR